MDNLFFCIGGSAKFVSCWSHGLGWASHIVVRHVAKGLSYRTMGKAGGTYWNSIVTNLSRIHHDNHHPPVTIINQSLTSDSCENSGKNQPGQSRVLAWLEQPGILPYTRCAAGMRCCRAFQRLQRTLPILCGVAVGLLVDALALMWEEEGEAAH